MTLRSSALLLIVAACDSGGGGTDTSDTGGGATERTRDYFVNTTDVYTGDAACNGTDMGQVDPAKQVMTSYNGEVHDFQSEDEVPEADVMFWLGDDINGAADTTLQADTNGAFTTEVPTCTPVAYGTFTPADWDQTVDTYEVHQVYGYEEDGVIDGEWINSVSQTTSKLIPGIIGIEWDPTTGIIAGTAFDCLENPVGNAQVFIHDGAGGIPATGEIFYFTDGDNGLPTNHDIANDASVDNGLWVAVNIPVGTWTAEMWVFDGAEYVLLGSTRLDIKAGSVNISNIYTGHDDGIAYPESCLLVQ